MFSVQKQQFTSQFEIFLKTKYNNGFYAFGWTIECKLCEEKTFFDAFECQK